MKPALRKLTLTAHVTASVGWLGAVAAYLVPAIVGPNLSCMRRVLLSEPHRHL